MKAVALIALCCVAAAHAKIYFEEKFDGAHQGPLHGALIDLRLPGMSTCAWII